MDHTIYNLFLALRYPGILLFDFHGETIFVVEDREALEFYNGYKIVIENSQEKFQKIVDQIAKTPLVLRNRKF
ncbi:MAG: hypothetical protein SNF33_07990 [Candidatus Algichlamydia australiensis]|nr:hypothetical protein [Chlamydiales bacterium]